MDEEETLFLQKFRRLPSSFSLKTEDRTKSKETDVTKKKVQLKCAADEFDSNTEWTRAYNLLSFLHWKADERDKAHEHNRKALELEKENIVALCNRVWMLREDGHLTEANEKLTEAEKLVECNQDLLIQGKAEIAYSYSVFGPLYFSQSVDMYNQLLAEIADKGIATKDVQLWKLDLGIIYRKYCNSANILPKEDWNERSIDDFIKKAALLFNEVISSNCPARWKGRCFASLAELSYSIYTGIQVTRSQGELFPKEIADKDVETLLNLALEACMEDSHVLKVCGKHFKYLKKLDKAEEVLRKALSIRKTSYSHHHLALVLKKKLKFRIIKERRSRDRRNYENENRRKESESCSRKKAPGYEIMPHQELTHRRNDSHPNIQYPVERRGHYFRQLSSTNDEIAASKKNPRNMAIEKGRVEGGVASASQQLASPYLRFNTDQPPIGYERYQNMKKALAKSFSYVFDIPASEKEAVEEILHHLDKAIEFRNEWASVEKGIVLRQVKEHKKAFDAFLLTLNMKGLSSTIITVSCYEHLGACCRDIAKEEVDLEKKRTFESDSIKYCRKAIETIAYKASKELGYLKDASMAYPTLKDMFQSQKRSIKILKELADLSTMLKKYGETLDFYQQIKEMDEEQLKDSTIIRRQIKILLENGEFEQAVVLLDLQNCTKGKDEISKEFCKLVYLECAFYLLNNKQEKNAGQRFRQAFDIYCTEIPREEADFDIFLIYAEDIETDESGSPSFAFELAKKLENFVPGESGLRITSNSDNVKPGRELRQAQTQQMDSSIHIVLILDSNDEPQGELKYFRSIAQEIEKKKKSKLSLILFDKCTCPLELSAFPKMNFDTKLFQSEDDFIGWICKFFFHLLGINKREHLL